MILAEYQSTNLTRTRSNKCNGNMHIDELGKLWYTMGATVQPCPLTCSFEKMSSIFFLNEQGYIRFLINLISIFVLNDSFLLLP